MHQKLTRLRLFPFLAVTAFTCGPVSLMAAPVVIDDFSDDLAPVTASTSLDGAMLGGELDAGLNQLEAVTFGIFGGTGKVAGVVETGGANNIQLVYDGEDGSPLLAYGLPNIDLTDGGSNDRIVIDLSSVTGNIEIRVIVSEDGSNSSGFTISGITSPGILEFPFASFTNFGIGANFAAAKQVECRVFLDTGEGFEIDSFIATASSQPVADGIRPNIGALKKSRLKTPRSRHAIKGTSSDNDTVVRVEAKTRGTRYKPAKLKPSGQWIFRTPSLKPGNNLFQIRAVDASGNKSQVLRIRVRGL